MHPPDPLRLPRRALLVVFAIAALLSAHAVFVAGDLSVYAEDGPLEDLQAAILAFGCLGFVVAARRSARAERLVAAACAWLCFAFVLNELDLEKLDVPRVFQLLGAGPGRNLLTGAGAVLLAALAARDMGRTRRAVAAFLRSTPGTLLLLAGAFLFAGRLFEKNIPVAHHAYWEELLELAGDCLILLAAWAAADPRVALEPRVSRPHTNA